MSPRALTAEIRRRVGIPAANDQPYRWTFTLLLVGVASVPLALAGYWYGVALAVAVGLVVIPVWRVVEQREALRRERIYTHGAEAVGHVLAVEPGGDRNGDRTVRIEFWSSGARFESSVNGCRLARRGLAPGDDVVVLFEPEEPQRCLVIERSRGGPVDAI